MDIQTLRNSLCNVNPCTSGTFTLEEKDKSATLRKVFLCDIPSESLIVKMDNIRFNNFLKDQKTWGFNKHSDYLIITSDKLVFIEIKSKMEVGQELKDECVQKFASDSCTLNYADKIFRELLSKTPFFENRESHYVLLYQSPSISKTPTTLGTDSPNTSPNSFRKISVSNDTTLSFRRTL
jgi:hypothetical protein